MNAAQIDWFDAVQTLGIIASLLFALKSFRDQARQQKVSNALLITQHHREVWGYMLDHPELQRVFDREVDLGKTPVSEQERAFVNMIFLHCAVYLKVAKAGLMHPVEGVEADIKDILSYPVPRTVWKAVRPFHEKEFAAFVERAWLEHSSPHS